MNVSEILSQPALNGLYRIEGTHPLVPILDGRSLRDSESLLVAIGRALDFPDYYGRNWDALDECLNDLSWRSGPVNLLIEHADVIPEDVLLPLLDIFAEAAREWRAQGRVFSLFLSGLDRSDLPPAR